MQTLLKRFQDAAVKKYNNTSEDLQQVPFDTAMVKANTVFGSKENTQLIADSAVFSDVIYNTRADGTLESPGAGGIREMASGRGYTVNAILTNKSTPHAKVAVLTKGKQTIVVFRGTTDAPDRAYDADLKDANVGGNNGEAVQNGFFRANHDGNLWGQIKAAIPAGNKVVFTGHSLGGANAQIAAYEYTKPNHPANPVPERAEGVKLITFGAPRAGNLKFAQALEKRLGREDIVRFVNPGDPVPYGPPRGSRFIAPDYDRTHAGKAVFIDPEHIRYFHVEQDLETRNVYNPGDMDQVYNKLIRPAGSLVTNIMMPGATGPHDMPHYRAAIEGEAVRILGDIRAAEKAALGAVRGAKAGSSGELNDNQPVPTVPYKKAVNHK